MALLLVESWDTLLGIMDGMELRILFNLCLQGRKGNNCLLMPLKSSILFKVSSAQQSKIGSGRVSVPRNDRYRMMTLPILHVFSSCVKASRYKSYNPFPLPESPWGVSHAVREINRGAELLEEVSSSLLDQSTEEAADIEDGEIESNHERGNVEGITKGLLEGQRSVLKWRNLHALQWGFWLQGKAGFRSVPQWTKARSFKHKQKLQGHFPLLLISLALKICEVL